MKEKIIFWVIAALFTYCCIILFIYTNSLKTCTEPVVSEITAATSIQANARIIKININTATLDELMTLDGIGEVTAQKIIDYRTDSGAFYSIEEIKEVSGIGEAKFEAIKNYITI